MADPYVKARQHLDAAKLHLEAVHQEIGRVSSTTAEAQKDCDIARWHAGLLSGKIAAPVTPTTPTTPTNPTTPTTPTNPVPSGKGIWVDVDYVRGLPAPPALVTSAAKGTVAANLADNNSNADANTYAAALLAVRGDTAARTRAVEGINSLPKSGYARVLEMSRNIPMYVMAANLLGNHDQDAFLKSLVRKPLQGHSGGNNMLETAYNSATNWGAMATAATTAIALHTNDTALAQGMARVMRDWCGESAGRFNFSDTDWHADSNNKRGVNRRGASRNGNSLDGVQPEDQRRSGNYTWPAPQAGYAWEGLTPRIVAAVMLNRAGLFDLGAGDDGLRRAVRWLYDVNKHPANGDDVTIVHVLNKQFGLGLPQAGDSIAKNVAFAGWTHK